MISWQSIAIALLTVGGLAFCGIGAICVLASGEIDEVAVSDRTIASGLAAGFVGALLLIAAFSVRFV